MGQNLVFSASPSILLNAIYSILWVFSNHHTSGFLELSEQHGRYEQSPRNSAGRRGDGRQLLKPIPKWKCKSASYRYPPPLSCNHMYITNIPTFTLCNSLNIGSWYNINGLNYLLRSLILSLHNPLPLFSLQYSPNMTMSVWFFFFFFFFFFYPSPSHFLLSSFLLRSACCCCCFFCSIINSLKHSGLARWRPSATWHGHGAKDTERKQALGLLADSTCLLGFVTGSGC